MHQSKLPENFIRTIKSVLPEFSGNGNDLISSYALDSFDLMTLRALLEEGLRVRYDDSSWIKIKKFHEFSTLAVSQGVQTLNYFDESSAKIERHYKLNMPQMNVSGLSEYWYLKEIGDMHWKMIASSLDVASDKILDQAGNRLYATFVRIKFTSTTSLREFNENDPIQLSAELSRFGSFYLSENILKKNDQTMKAELVTSFVARGVNNSELYKSIPIEEPKVSLHSYTEIPKLIEQYHHVRKNEQPLFDETVAPIFQCSYTLDPYHDINGVGLLYFAAYPHIFDVCERAFMNAKKLQKDWSFLSSTISRDIFYLGNSDLSDEIIYNLRKFSETNGKFTFVSELVRKSDGKRVSVCVCEKGTV
jgi:probable biosynthetic protein (TIGR04098 family)